MQTYPVFFHDWRGHAYRQDGQWHLVPKHLSDHLALDWRRQIRKIQDTNLSKGMALMAIPSARGKQETTTLKLAYFGAWVLSINEGKLAPHKRELLAAMQESLLDALDRQLSAMFNLPGMLEAEGFLRLPLMPQAYSLMDVAEVRAARDQVLADPQAFQAARFLRVGLPASKVAALVNRSIYWARQTARLCRKIGFVPLPAREQRLLDQPSLFGEV